jgi:hypothetical protein
MAAPRGASGLAQKCAGAAHEATRPFGMLVSQTGDKLIRSRLVKWPTIVVVCPVRYRPDSLFFYHDL